MPPTVPERRPPWLRGGARRQGPDAGVVPPARPRWVATARGGRRRPRGDKLLPRDLTRLGEKCERERESQPQRRELRAGRGRPSAPRPRPRPAGPQSRRLSGWGQGGGVPGK